MNMTNAFNHCVKLLYVSKLNIKKESSLGYHCDIMYNNDGVYMINQNEQTENTPTVILTFGDQRILKWRRKIYTKGKNGRKMWVPDISWNESIVMNNFSITIINTLDECPTKMNTIETLVKYQHGVEKIVNDYFSIGYVFRVVNNFKDYCSITNVMEINPIPIHSITKPAIVTDFNKSQYHKSLVEFYKYKFDKIF